MEVEANSRHLGVITIFIIASLLPHLMRKCFTKGPTFWILTLHRKTFSCQVFVPLKGAPGDAHVGMWSFFQECLDAFTVSLEVILRILPSMRSLGTPVTNHQKCWNVKEMRSPYSQMGPRCRTKTEKEWAQLITGRTSGFWGPRRDSRNVYELDLSVVNQVMAKGEAVMNLTLIGRGRSFNNNISVRRINVLREDPTSLGLCNPFSSTILPYTRK